MAMNGNNRGDAAYNAIAGSNPDFAKLSPSEQNTLKSYFELLFSADTTYIIGNMDVLPVALSGPALNNPIGQAVNIPSTSAPGLPSVGATSALQTVAGKGSVV